MKMLQKAELRPRRIVRDEQGAWANVFSTTFSELNTISMRSHKKAPSSAKITNRIFKLVARISLNYGQRIENNWSSIRGKHGSS